MNVVIAYDLGTSGLKASMFDVDTGATVGFETVHYPTRYAADGTAEQEPDTWWHAVGQASRSLKSRHAEIWPSLIGVGCTGMMNSALLVNRHGDPVRPAMIHADTRGTSFAQRFESDHGRANIFDRTSNRPDCHLSLPKLMYLTQNEPQSLESAAFAIQAKDFIVSRLTGVIGVTDPSDASLTGAFDVVQREWAADLWQSSGVDIRLLPRVVPSTMIVGHVTRSASDWTELPEGLPVIMGGGDGPCATAGSGTLRGDAYLYLGGTAWMGVNADTPCLDDRLANYCSLDGGVTVFGTVQSAGSSVDWLWSVVGKGQKRSFAHQEFDALRVPAGSEGLFFLPYLQGERAPIWNPNARGVFFGLSPHHTAGHLYRAVIEGVAYSFSSILSIFEETGTSIDSLRMLGTAATSELWQQVLSGVLNRSLVEMRDVSSATSLGAAIATSVGVGVYASIDEATRAMTQTARTTLPSDRTVSEYRPRVSVFRELYPALKYCFESLAGLEETFNELGA